MSTHSKSGTMVFLFASLAAIASGCNGSGSDASSGTVLGQDGVGVSTSGGSNDNSVPTSDTTQGTNPTPTATVTPAPTPTSTSTPTPTPSVTPTPSPTTVGSSCHSSDSNQICLALKYVAYSDSKGTPVASEQDAIQNLTNINSVWKTCNIAFQIDDYVTPDPTQYGLTFNTANYEELDTIRSKFEDAKTLLVVTTGTWDRSGSLGNTGANAWTNMPGNTYYGSILEAAVATYSNIIAHELGHYLNLDHVSDTSNLMTPIIYTTSTQLTSSQCSSARSAVQSYWSSMKR